MSTSLFPHLSGFRIADRHITSSTIVLDLVPRYSIAACPLCRRRSHRIHRRYQRSLQDLPCCGIPLILRLHVRRFVCCHRRCRRRIFCERLPNLALPRMRRTQPLRLTLAQIGFALGGEAGSRLATVLGMIVSPATLLRLIHGTPLPEHETIRVLGVDDWAFRRGHRYGTLMVDLERHRVVDLLPDWTADTVAAWLRGQAPPQIMSRDRGGPYAEAGRRGVPDAVQVADRFHLTKNLVDTLETIFLHHQYRLRAVAATVAEERSLTDDPVPQDVMYGGKRHCARTWEKRMEAASLEPHAGHIERYHEVRTLFDQGIRVVDIARRNGVSRKTVYADIRRTAPPERKRPARHPADRVLAPYEAYLLRRWWDGCHNGVQLWREIQERGYTFSR